MTENEKKQPTGFEGEPGSYVVVDGKRQPNPDAPKPTLTPDDQGYHELKRKHDEERRAKKAVAAVAGDTPATQPAPAKGGK